MCAMSSSESTNYAPVKFGGLKNTENVVFFGNNLGVECQRCGAYNQTSMGHKYCAHVSCPIALREFKRRRRKRTSTLEQVYMPQRLAALRQKADERQKTPAAPKASS